MPALSRIVCRQCGQVRVAPAAPARTGVMPARPRSPSSCLGLLLPTELDLAAHLRAGRDRERLGGQVAVEDAGREKLDALGAVDVAVDLPRDRTGVGANASGERRAGLDREIPLH